MSKVQSRVLLFFAAATVVFLGLLILLHTYPNVNVLWLGDATHRWLLGGSYAENFFENNPPMILYLNVIPVFIAKKIHLPFILVYDLYILLIGITSIFLTVNQLLVFTDYKEYHLQLSITIFLFALYFLLPLTAYGDREHLMVLLVLPYVASIAIRRDGVPIVSYQAIALGAIAGLGFALKPYFLLTFIFLECYLFLCRRDWQQFMRPEFLIITLVGLVYFSCIFAFTPSYMTTILPMVHYFYLGYEKVQLVSLLPYPVLFSILPAMSLPFVLRCWFNISNLTYVFCLATIGFFFSYVIQEKNWYYHALPMLTMMLLTYFTLFCDLPKRQVFLKSLLVIITLFFVLYLYIPGLIRRCVTHDSAKSKMASLIHAVGRLGSGRDFLLLSTELNAARVAYMNGDHLIPRFPAFWMLPGILDRLQKKHNQFGYHQALAAKKFLLESMAADIARYHPSVVMVNVAKKQAYLYAPPALHIENFSYIKFFSQNPTFSRYWLTHYIHWKTLCGYAIYRSV